jgi:NADH-quinone oxidoreductase subunit I
LAKVVAGLRSLLVGLSITFAALWRTLVRRQAVTLRYPHQAPVLSPNYRSAIQLIRFDETGSHDCVACLQCEKICPSACITIDGVKVDGIKKQRAVKFAMDFALCSLCGLCLDVCPTTTLEYSKRYDEAGYDRDWTFDLLAPFAAKEDQWRDEQRERERLAAEDKQRAAEEKKKAAAANKAPDAKTADAKPADPDGA